MASDLISRKALIAEYDRVHIGAPGGARKLMEDAPTVDAVEVTDKELLRAIKLLIKQYEHSKNSEYVHSPVAYALYHTWRQVDERRTDP
jgi:hypothetical protein